MAPPTEAPEVEPVHTPSVDMTMDEKLAVIDQEIRTLHQFCINKGYNPFEVEKSAKPLFRYVRKERGKKWLRALQKLAMVVAVLAAIMCYDPAYRIVAHLGRRASISVLPYWDWAHLYYEDCLLENPYYKAHELLDEDCELCENIEKIERFSNMSQRTISEDFLKRDIPFIITDGMDDWPAVSKFSVNFLEKLYSQEESLREVMPCMFHSNVRIKYGHARALLRKASAGDITNWYGHWENCDKIAAKTLRQFYFRPYFMPPMVEMSESNWLFVASQYKGKKNKPADIGMPMMMFAVVKGQSRVQLTPRKPCDKICPKLYSTLHEREMVVVTDLMWLLDYKPIADQETISIGAGGFFD